MNANRPQMNAKPLSPVDPWLPADDGTKQEVLFRVHLRPVRVHLRSLDFQPE